MVFPLYFLALVAFNALAAPAGSNDSQTLSNSTQNLTRTTSSLFPDAHSDTNRPITSTPLPSPSASSSGSYNSTHSITRTTPSLFPDVRSATNRPIKSTPLPSPSASSSSLAPTSTLVVTEIATIFATSTIYATPPASSTTIVTVIVTTTITAPPTATPTKATSWANRTTWTAPQHMSNLSSFNITYFPTGQKNLDIVSTLPLTATKSKTRTSESKNPLVSQTGAGTNQSQSESESASMLQLVYPSHSVNPGSKPAGGADFYASPLNLAGATNVTFEYSVFFPADFDWVKGGKLPGLYGGHTGCSGGSSATNCFSTRLMWRQQGVGELYLYAPKDKQSDALCADPQSVCDTTYGFSIGRGSFNFSAGEWTNVKQHVVLNTPGQKDGRFTLVVNGERVIDRTDLLYRDEKTRRTRGTTSTSKSKLDSSPDLETSRSLGPSTSSQVHSSSSPSTGAQDQNPLLGLLGILRRQTTASNESPFPRTSGTKNELNEAARAFVVSTRAGDASGEQPAEFIGIFFRYVGDVASTYAKYCGDTQSGRCAT